MWDSFGELEEQEAHERAFGGNVGAPAINLDSAGNLIPPLVGGQFRTSQDAGQIYRFDAGRRRGGRATRRGCGYEFDEESGRIPDR